MPRMMIVDDSPFLKGILKFILENAGHKVVGMATGYQEAIEMYRTQKPDVVFCDVPMGDFEGLEIVKAIAETDPSSRIVTIAVGGHEAKVAEAGRLGACAHVDKPYGVVKVADAIDLALKRR